MSECLASLEPKKFSHTTPEEAEHMTSAQKYTNATLNTGYSLFLNGSDSADAMGTERKSQKANGARGKIIAPSVNVCLCRLHDVRRDGSVHADAET